MKNMYSWVGEQISKPVKKAIPILSFPSTQLMGITVKDLVSDSRAQAEGMRQISQRCPTGAVVSPMDLSVEAEAFGADILYTDHEVPNVRGALVHSAEEARALPIPNVGDGRTGIYLDAVKKALGMITSRPVLAGTIGPFSLVGRLAGMSDIIILCRRNPGMVELLLDKVTPFLIKYIKAYKEAGAHGVIIAEPAAGLLAPSMLSRFSSPYCRQIVEAVQDENFIIVYHNCGPSVTKAVSEILLIGAAAYHFGNTADLTVMIPQFPKDVLVMGNIDPVNYFFSGNQEKMSTATLELMTSCCQYPNFIISSGCDIPPAAPWDNIDTFFEAVEKFYTASLI